MAKCYTAKTIGEGRGGYGRVLHSQDNRRGEGRGMAECYTAKTIGEGRGGYGRVLHSQDNRRGEGRVW